MGVILRLWRWLTKPSGDERLLQSVRHWERQEWQAGVEGICWKWPLQRDGGK